MKKFLIALNLTILNGFIEYMFFEYLEIISRIILKNFIKF